MNLGLYTITFSFLYIAGKQSVTIFSPLQTVALESGPVCIKLLKLRFSLENT